VAIALPDVRSGHALERAEAASISYPAAFWAVALAALALRVAASFVFDLNLMESYGAVMARYPSLSYADHPPLTWWLIGLVTHIAGSEAAPVVRAPFILLFLGTSWLLYGITERLFGARPAFYAAAALTLSPLFGLWVGALALTDGLAIFFALASVRCLVVILFEAPQNRPGIWIAWLLAGLFFGLALASKYTAILLVPGLFLFLLTGGSAQRRWLVRPEPYAAILAAAIPLLPVLIWNAEHEWTSFVFQGSRAGFSGAVHFGRALRWLGMQFLYLQPWIFIAAISALGRGLKAGPRNERAWFCACLAVTPLVFFVSVMCWSNHSLRGYHWGAVGYVMLFPLIGASFAELAARYPRRAKRWAGAVATTYAAALLFLVSHAMTGWATAVAARIDSASFTQKDPILVELFDWKDLNSALQDRHIDPARSFVAGKRWEACSKAAYALAGSYDVLCLAPNNIHFSYIADPGSFKGRDAIIVDPSTGLADIKTALGAYFDAVVEEPPVSLTYFGRTITALKVYRGLNFHGGSWKSLEKRD
jgi:4-amino-4-deoxy-L-arabinose transferase-like glycosyltransferase